MSDFCSVFTLLPFISHWSNHVTVSTLKKKSFSKAGLWLVINRTTVRVNRSASQGGTTSSNFNRLIILFRSWILTRECFIQHQRNRTQNNINKVKIYKSQTLCVCLCLCRTWTFYVTELHLSPRLHFDRCLHSISHILPSSVWTVPQPAAPTWWLHGHTAARLGFTRFSSDKMWVKLRSAEEKKFNQVIRTTLSNS